MWLYSYFDATKSAEFLYDCVRETITKDLPDAVAYLDAYRRFSDGIRQRFEMPDSTVDLLHRFLGQNGGRLSKRARSKEFAPLSNDEINYVESLFSDCFSVVPMEFLS